jgi:hypothetical protein
MFDYLLTEEQIKIRDEVRDLVKWVPRQMVLDVISVSKPERLLPEYKSL